MLYPKRYDLNPLILGYDWSFEFIYEVGGSPLDFTGYSMEMRVFDDYLSPYLGTWTSQGGEITLGQDGHVKILIKANNQHELTIGMKKYVIILTYPQDPESQEEPEAYPILTGNLPVIDIDGIIGEGGGGPLS